MSTPGATYRRILTSFWTDPDIRRNVREPDAKAVLLYFFTCPDSTLSGLYFQPLDYVATHTCVSIDRVHELVERFQGRYLTYDPETEEVFVHALWKHNVGPDFKPRDNRSKALLRQAADTHSDRLVGRLIEEYPDWKWPADVVARAESSPSYPQPTPPSGKQAPSKPLPSQNHATPPEGDADESEGAYQATHAHAHAVTHTHAYKNNPAVPTSPVVETKQRASVENSIEERRAEQPAEGNLEDDQAEIWERVKKAAVRLGQGRLSMRQEQANRSILIMWRNRMDRDPATILAAVEGACLLREEGVTWLEPEQPYTLAALNNTRTLVDMGDGEVERPLWEVAVERYYSDGEDRSRRGRTGPTLVGDVLSGLIDRGAA